MHAAMELVEGEEESSFCGVQKKNKKKNEKILMKSSVLYDVLFLMLTKKTKKTKKKKKKSEWIR